MPLLETIPNYVYFLSTALLLLPTIKRSLPIPTVWRQVVLFLAAVAPCGAARRRMAFTCS